MFSTVFNRISNVFKNIYNHYFCNAVNLAAFDVLIKVLISFAYLDEYYANTSLNRKN